MVTDAGMAQLQQRLPFLDLSQFDSSRKVEDLRGTFTVETIVKFVQTKLD